jgi:hypothetical protein
MEINNLAKEILLALLQNPERYKYIADIVDRDIISQEEANMKNINKAFKIAESFMQRIEERRKNNENKRVKA